MEAWTDIYKEIAEKITDNITEIKWVDLWHEQVSYLTTELPFPTPAVFIAFRMLEAVDEGLLVQHCNMQVDMYYFVEHFADTYTGSYNQESAMDFLRTLTDLYTLFHGKKGVNYYQMRRVDMVREDSGDAGNLYRISFQCIVPDVSAQLQYNHQIVNEVEVSDEEFNRPQTQDDDPGYIITM